MSKLLRLSSLFLVLGLVFLIFGFLGRFFLGDFNWYVIAHLLLAIFLFLLAIPGFYINRLDANANKTDRTAFSSLCALFFLCAALVAINYWAAKADLRVDLTEQKIHSLDSISKQVVKTLNSPIEIFVLSLPKASETYESLELARLFQSENSDLITVNSLDPLRQPALAKQLGVKKFDQLVLRNQAEQVLRVSKANESNITAALNKLSSGHKDKVLYLEGYNQPSLDDDSPEGLLALNAALSQEGIEFEPLALDQQPIIPKTAQALMLVAPEIKLAAKELTAIREYLSAGGNLIVFDEPSIEGNLNYLIADYGIKIEPAVVLDFDPSDRQRSEASWQVTSSNFGRHAITSGLAKGDLVAFLYAAPLTLAPDLVKSGSLSVLTSSAASAWGERNLSGLQSSQPSAEFDRQADLPGPLVIGAAYQAAKTTSNTGRVVVFGDSTWIRNQNFSLYANSSLAVQSFKWAISSTGQALPAARSYRRSVVLLANSDFELMLVLACLLPELILLSGLVLCWRRNQFATQNVAA